jgi:hypothetical protein
LISSFFLTLIFKAGEKKNFTFKIMPVKMGFLPVPKVKIVGDDLTNAQVVSTHSFRQIKICPFRSTLMSFN